MPKPTWTDAHARLISETAPPTQPPSEADVDRVWNQVASVVATPERPRRSRRRIAIGVGLAAVIAGTSGVAMANLQGSRTGDFNTDPESVRLGGPGEHIDPRGSDYEAVLVEEISDIPFPSVEAHDIAVADQMEFARQDAADMEKARKRGREDWRIIHVTGGMRAEAARAAICAWANEWAAATTAGDAEGRAAATAMLDSSRTWPAVTDVDAKQRFSTKQQWVTDSTTGTTTRESYQDETPFAYLPLVVEAAHGDDFKAMGKHLRTNTRCIPALMPDLPNAVPAMFRNQ